jgi:glycosyltransferase involved in cell wall biosynthesis
VLDRHGTAIRRLHTAGEGVAAARNAALAAARGTFVAFLDDDDAWSADKTAQQLAAMIQRPELALTFCDYTLSDPDEAGGFRPRATRRFAGEPSLARLLESNFIGTLTVMARRDVLLAAGGFATALACGSDYDLWLRVRRRHPIARIPAVLADYRWHPNSLTGASRRRNTQHYVDVIERLAAEDPELFAQAGAAPAALLAAARQRMAEMT